MGQNLFAKAIKSDIERFLSEDDLGRNLIYTKNLPDKKVKASLHFKSDLVIAGLPWFVETFSSLGAELSYETFLPWEGRSVLKNEKSSLQFELPFDAALMGERVGLNLLQRASAIATHTSHFVKKAKEKKIAILDTRKTTPGLRSIEKYAVRIGGGYNHRLGQVDTWMVKDNHKSFFGGLREAMAFFQAQGSFYNSMVVEIHDMEELKQAIALDVRHVMLDNFSPTLIRDAITLKPADMTYEVSGGVRLETLEDFLIEGVDAISIGALTYAAPAVDISLKFGK